jgi:T4-like virus tail tube protein gp19
MRKSLLSLGATAATATAAAALVLAAGASPDGGRSPIVDGVDLKTAPATMHPESGDYPSYDYQLVSITNAWPKKYTGVGLKADSNEVAVEGITLDHEGFEIQ